MMQDKRDYKRYNIFLESVSCSRSEKEDIEVNVSDLSCSGLGIDIKEKLSKDDSIELELFVPDDDIPMFIEGVVAWVNKNANTEESYQAGVKITRINRYDKDRLAKYLYSSFAYLIPE